MANRIRVVKVYSSFSEGLAGVMTEIEISLANGLPIFDFIGMCDSSIKESRGRICTALSSSGFTVPRGHVTVSISPSYMKKSGSSFDLPIAIGLLLVSGQIRGCEGMKIYAEGELSLTGEVKGTPGGYIRMMSDEVRGYDKIFFPADEGAAAGCLGLKGFGISTLKDVLYILSDPGSEPLLFDEGDLFTGAGYIDEYCHDISELKGQEKAKRGMLIAASGFHNIVFLGSPGCGKSLSSNIIGSLLPPPGKEEIKDIILACEACGIPYQNKRPLIRIDPGTSPSKLKGSSARLDPGLIVRANRGILFADELSEFSPGMIDLLRLPLEEHVIRLNKDGKIFEFPSSFMFVGAGNPCRCGMYYEKGKVCRCTMSSRKRYLSKYSGAFLDRIDIFTEMRSVDISGLELISGGKVSDETKRARETVSRAWDMQFKRYGDIGRCLLNGTLNKIPEEGEGDLLRASSEVRLEAAGLASRYSFSARGLGRILRVGRTIADMEGRADMKKEDVMEASMYRMNEIFGG